MKGLATAVFVAASAAVFAQQPASDASRSPQNATSSQQQPQQQQPPSQSGQSGQVTVTGCLTSAQNVFTLTANGSQPGASAPTTVTYTLQPTSNVDLKSQVNHKVEIKGTETAAQGSARVVDSTRSQAPTGTSGSGNAGANGATGSAGANATGGPNAGGRTPVVETTAKAQIVAKTLSVNSVRTVAAQCDPIAK